MKKILILGGTGFLGVRLAKQLLEAGHKVTVTTRSEARVAQIEAMGAEPLVGDLGQPGPLLASVGPHDALINVARPPFEVRRYSRREMAALQELTNCFVKTTLALGDKLDCPMILTRGAAYETVGDQVADESWPLDFVGIAEFAAHTSPIVDAALKRGAPLITMLPGQIYGAAGLFLEKLYTPMMQGKYRVLGAGANCSPWVHVDDALSAYLWALDKLPLGDSFIIADDIACTWREFADCMAEALGLPPPGSVPAFMIALIKGRRIHKTVTMNCRVSNAHAKEVLGWKLQYPSYREGIPATIAQIGAAD